jgi:hypothetical protein
MPEEERIREKQLFCCKKHLFSALSLSLSYCRPHSADDDHHHGVALVLVF